MGLRICVCVGRQHSHFVLAGGVTETGERERGVGRLRERQRERLVQRCNFWRRRWLSSGGMGRGSLESGCFLSRCLGKIREREFNL